METKDDEVDKKKWIYFVIKISRSAVKRYFAMFNICLLGLGTFVCFDSVGALQLALMQKFDIDYSNFSLMYSVNSWANIIISPFGGFLIDRVFGIRIGTIFYGLVFVAGHLVFSLGATLVSFWCSLFGRFINGIGHEFLYIAMQLYSVHYFKGKELSMIMCTNISVARLGSSLVYTISEPLLKHVRSVAAGTSDVGIVLFIVGSFTLLTMIAAVVLMFMTPKSKQSKSNDAGNEKSPAHCDHPQIEFKDIFNLPLEFWLIIFIQTSFAVSIYVFLPFTQELFKTVSSLDVAQANEVTSFFNIAGVIIAPILGIIIDRFGREIYVIHLGFVCAFLAHLILGFSQWSPYISMFILSLAYGLFNGSVLPMMALLIPVYKLGTAYGVACTFGNAAYALCTYLCGLTIDRFQYVGLAVFMLVVIGVGAVFSLFLQIVNSKRNGILNLSAVERKVFLEKENSEEKDESTVPLKSQPETNGVMNPQM